MPAPDPSSRFTRRRFLAATTAALGTAPFARAAEPAPAGAVARPAATEWPQWDARDEAALREALNSGNWGRLNGRRVKEFEAAFAERMKARYCGAAEMSRWAERNRCPQNDQLCEQAVWLPHHVLLGSRADMERIAEAIADIQRRAGGIARG